LVICDLQFGSAGVQVLNYKLQIANYKCFP